ncbi:MAG: hypothetical protein Q8P82_01985 [bacterium]|nr:hypothetical protein [bacterium]
MPWAQRTLPNTDRRASLRQLFRDAYTSLQIYGSVPFPPELRTEEWERLDRYQFLPIFFPKVIPNEFPARFIPPDWSSVDRARPHFPVRRSLSGTWMAIEMIQKSDFRDRQYALDLLAYTAGIASRFGTSADSLHNSLISRCAEVIGFPRDRVRLPSVEEWNWSANIMNYLRIQHSIVFPDLGSTSSSEWCANACGLDFQSTIGSGLLGGISAVRSHPSNLNHPELGFRLIIDLGYRL